MNKLIFLAIFVPIVTNADWILDNSRSEISFISTKNLSIGETHKFQDFEGTLDSNGKLLIKIDLNSVETGIPIRDERMKRMFFETTKHQQAVISANIDLSFSKSVSVGDIQKRSEKFTLDLHGEKSTSEASIALTLIKDGSVRVDSLRPVIITASLHNLTEGLEALRVIAKLASISESVPVSFDLFFLEK
tara:strand:+ start:664 stop:1233 length:570 start_codon:yes stop_codon:yes gene_type:complete